MQRCRPRSRDQSPLIRCSNWFAAVRLWKFLHSESQLGARTGARDIGRARGFRSLLLTPLRNEQGLIGLISVTRKEPGTFADHHVQLLRTFADQAVIAIENVRLFDQVKLRTDELSRSLNDLQTAQNRLIQTEKLASLGQLTAGIAHEIRESSELRKQFRVGFG